MDNTSINIGNLNVEFDGSIGWKRKASMNLAIQIKWLNPEIVAVFFQSPIRFAFSDSESEYSIIEDDKTIRLGITKWYMANASIIFQIAALANKCIMVHANCILNNNNEAFVFTAHGGVGKTSMLLELYSQPNNFHFGGDDLVFINPESGTVVPYYRPMCIYKYHYKTFSKLFANLNIRYFSPSIIFRIINRINIILKSFFGDNKYNKFYDLLKLVPATGYYLLDPISFFDLKVSLTPYKLRKISYLEKSTEFKVEEVYKNILQEKICYSTTNEFHGYLKTLDIYCNLVYNQSFAGYLEEAVSKTLDYVPVKKMIYTSGKWTSEQVKQVLNNE